MKTTKETKKQVRTESGKQVFDAGKGESTKKTHKGASLDATSADKCETWESAIYNAIKDTETSPTQNSVKLCELRNCKDLPALLADIDARNEATENANRKAVLRNAICVLFGNGYEYTRKDKEGKEQKISVPPLSFASVEERENARKIAKARFLNTKGFRITFQAESDERTTATYENGAYFSRPTNYTAAGVFASFNSCKYTKRTAAQMAAKKAAEAKAEETRQALSNFDTSALLALLTPSQLAALSEKMKK